MPKLTDSAYYYRYWPVWFLMGILWLITQLPYRVQLFLGKQIGLLAMHVAKRERNIARINLEKCFPEKTNKQRQQLMRESFISMGIGLIETAFGWWASDKRLKRLAHVEGLEHVKTALKSQKGALICVPHFSSIHLAGRLIRLYHPFAAMYFPPKHPVIREITQRAMARYYEAGIPRHDVRLLIKTLKKNIPVFYTPDTDAGPKNSIFAPFFGIQTATVTATARFAKISACKVIFATSLRRKTQDGYDLIFFPALDHYPSLDDYQDAVRMNKLIESAVRKHPEQYLWQYKRFKTRPPGEEKWYKKSEFI